MQKFLRLIRYHVFIFVSVSIILGGESEMILLQCILEHVLPKFSSRNFMVANLTFRSLIYFELVFVYDVKEWSKLIYLFIYFMCSSLVLRTPFVERTVFNMVQCCLLCCRLSDHRCVHLFLGFLSCCIDLCVWLFFCVLFCLPVPPVFITVAL